jgi:hypothetical protein
MKCSWTILTLIQTKTNTEKNHDKSQLRYQSKNRDFNPGLPQLGSDNLPTTTFVTNPTLVNSCLQRTCLINRNTNQQRGEKYIFLPHQPTVKRIHILPATSCVGTMVAVGEDTSGDRGGGITGDGSRCDRGGGDTKPQPFSSGCGGWANTRPRPKITGLKFTNSHSSATFLVQAPALLSVTSGGGPEPLLPPPGAKAYFRRLILVFKLDIRQLGSDVNHIGVPPSASVSSRAHRNTIHTHTHLTVIQPSAHRNFTRPSRNRWLQNAGSCMSLTARCLGELVPYCYHVIESIFRDNASLKWEESNG